MMRILHYLERLNLRFGGPVRAVTDLCANLSAKGHLCSITTYDGADAPAGWTESDFGKDPGAAHPSVYPVPFPTKAGLRFPKESLAKIDALMARADVLHLHGVWTPSNLQVAKLARARGVPYVVSLRGMLDDWCMTQGALKKRVFLALGMRRLLEQAAFVHCTAQGELDQSGKWFPKGRGIVLPNLLDLKPFRDPPGPELARREFAILNAGRPTLLFLSRVHYKKGIEHLIRAAAVLRDHGVPVSTVIAGDGEGSYVESLKSLANELKLGDTIAFVGHVNGAKKVSLFEAADVFVLPTSQENFGFVLLEALAAGTPVVTTPGVDIWPELKSSGASLIEPAEAEKIAGAVAGILRDPPLKEAMGRNGRAWVMAEFDEGKIVEGYEGMYERMRGTSG